MRSKLFVPCSRPELFAKALASAADAISFDLEDAVPEAGKASGRTALTELLRSDAVLGAKKVIIIRVNALGSSHFAADVAALTGCQVDYVNLPKVEAPEDVTAALGALDTADVVAPVLVNIESARGLANAAAIAAADPRVAGLQAGLNDLFAALGAARHEAGNVHAALWTIRLASAEAGCFAYDGAWPDIADDEGFRAEAAMARSLGFLGKSCIHPRQVPLANEVFDAGEEVAAAVRLLAAARAAAADGRGAFVLDGRMIDRPVIDQARALLAATER